MGDHIGHYADAELVLLGPNLPHTWHAEEGRVRHEAVVVQFQADFLGPAEKVPEARGIGRLVQRSSRGLVFHGRTRAFVAERMVAMRLMSGLQRLAELLVILDRLAMSRECNCLASPAYVSTFSSEDEIRLSGICEFISRHYDRSLTLPEAANKAHMSEAGFSRYFKRAVGKSFTAYLGELRVGQACRLLIETDLAISEICHGSGFGGLSNFNRRFILCKPSKTTILLMREP